VRTQTADGGLWRGQGDSMRSLLQDHSDYMCRLCQLTVGCDQTTAIAWEASGKITPIIHADSDSQRWALTRLGRLCEKPLTRSGWLYVWILTADNGLWHDQGDRMQSLWQDHGDYSDNRPWVLTRQWDCTSSLYQTIQSGDLAYMITPCLAQTLSLSPHRHVVCTPKQRGKVKIPP